MDSNKQEKFEFSQYLSNISALLGLLSILAFWLSFVYDFSYFLRIDTKFLVFYSIGDYLPDALIWLPISIFAGLFGLAYRLAGELENDRYRELQVARGKASPKDAPGYGSEKYAFRFVILMSFFGFFVIPANRLEAYAFLFIVFAWLINVVINHIVSHILRGSPEVISIVYLFLIFTVASAVNGYTRSVHDINKEIEEGKFYIYDGGPAIVVRRLSSGYIVRDIEEKTVLFLDDDGKRIFSVRVNFPPRESRLCLWFGMTCSNDAALEEKT